MRYRGGAGDWLLLAVTTLAALVALTAIAAVAIYLLRP